MPAEIAGRIAAARTPLLAPPEEAAALIAALEKPALPAPPNPLPAEVTVERVSAIFQEHLQKGSGALSRIDFKGFLQDFRKDIWTRERRKHDPFQFLMAIRVLLDDLPEVLAAERRQLSSHRVTPTKKDRLTAYESILNGMKALESLGVFIPKFEDDRPATLGTPQAWKLKSKDHRQQHAVYELVCVYLQRAGFQAPGKTNLTPAIKISVGLLKLINVQVSEHSLEKMLKRSKDKQVRQGPDAQ